MAQDTLDQPSQPLVSAPARADRHVLFAGVAAAAILGVGLGLWARPAMSERRMAVAAAEAKAAAFAAPLRTLQIVVDDTAAPVGAPIEVLGEPDGTAAQAPPDAAPMAPLAAPALVRVQAVEAPEPVAAPAPAQPRPKPRAEPVKLAIAKAPPPRLAPPPHRLEKASVQKADVQKASVRKIVAEKARLQKITAEAARPHSAKAKLEKARLEKVQIGKTRVERVRLERAKAETAKVDRARPEKATLEKARLERARLEKTRLEKARVQKASVEKAKLEKTRLERIKLERTRLEALKVDRLKADKVRLERARLLKAKAERSRKPAAQPVRVQKATVKTARPHRFEPPPRVVPTARGAGPLRLVRATRPDPVLTAVDRQMTRAYSDARAAGVPDAQLRRQQERWQAARSAAAREAPWAVHDVYLARIAELHDLTRDARDSGY
jgi:uncharacterized protein YjbI with pentapeptide repeats